MNAKNEISYINIDLNAIAKRPERSNKYTFGKVLFVCGSHGMSGAAYLASLAAYRTGAGLCELYTAEDNRIILQTLLPEAVVKTYTDDVSGVSALISGCDAIVLGCGLGKSDKALELVERVLSESSVPTVVDADALNLISEHEELKKKLRGKIITPHFAEMARLSGIGIPYISENTEEVCADFAGEHGCVCVLKDHKSIVSDGRSVYINQSGNSAMAKAGSGDLLAGIIGALAARRDTKLPLLDAACLGVYIHGLAGDAARDRLGEFSVLARDIASSISCVMKNI